LKLGDVHWVDLPDRGGREQRGRRPAVIWQDTAAFSGLPTILVIPLSSQQGALRFSGTALIQPSSANGLSLPSVALVFQIGACDVRRIEQRIGRLSDSDLATIRALARQLQGLG
jgi:Growth inhibitor